METGVGMMVTDDLNVLQWGHRLSVVETVTMSGRQLRSPMLQWGHRLSVVETSSSGWWRVAVLTGFNGATAFR